VATWEEFAAQEPELARLGQRILSKYGIAYLGTVRADGGPRVCPVSPVILAGHAYLGVMPDTPKRRDLDRDGRFTLHALPGPDDAEVSITGVARRIGADRVEELIRTAPPNVRIARDTFMYELDLERVNCTLFEDPGEGRRPRPTRTRWVAATAPA
jgi:pyridoxamine 5'-phosphate oxidase-like protein